MCYIYYKTHKATPACVTQQVLPSKAYTTMPGQNSLFFLSFIVYLFVFFPLLFWKFLYLSSYCSLIFTHFTFFSPPVIQLSIHKRADAARQLPGLTKVLCWLEVTSVCWSCLAVSLWYMFLSSLQNMSFCQAPTAERWVRPSLIIVWQGSVVADFLINDLSQNRESIWSVYLGFEKKTT